MVAKKYVQVEVEAVSTVCFKMNVWYLNQKCLISYKLALLHLILQDAWAKGLSKWSSRIRGLWVPPWISCPRSWQMHPNEWRPSRLLQLNFREAFCSWNGTSSVFPHFWILANPATQEARIFVSQRRIPEETRIQRLSNSNQGTFAEESLRQQIVDLLRHGLGPEVDPEGVEHVSRSWRQQ